MKKTKTCPKCGSNEIYTDKGQTKRGDRCSLPVSSWTKLFLDVYACFDCGFVEEYIEYDDLRNADKLEKLKKNWRKA